MSEAPASAIRPGNGTTFSPRSPTRLLFRDKQTDRKQCGRGQGRPWRRSAGVHTTTRGCMTTPTWGRVPLVTTALLESPWTPSPPKQAGPRTHRNQALLARGKRSREKNIGRRRERERERERSIISSVHPLISPGASGQQIHKSIMVLSIMPQFTQLIPAGLQRC